MQRPPPLVDFPRTKVGIIPYSHLQFGSPETHKPELQLDSGDNVKISIPVPNDFRDRVQLMCVAVVLCSRSAVIGLKSCLSHMFVFFVVSFAGLWLQLRGRHAVEAAVFQVKL